MSKSILEMVSRVRHWDNPDNDNIWSDYTVPTRETYWILVDLCFNLQV